SAEISSSDSEEMISSLISCSSACTGRFSIRLEVAAEMVGDASCGQGIPSCHADFVEKRTDRNVLTDLQRDVETPRGHTIPLLPLAQRRRNAADAYRRDVHTPAYGDVRGATLQPQRLARHAARAF